MFDLDPSCESTKNLVGSHSPTIQSRLAQTKRELEDRLAKVNAGLDVLAKDPKLAEQLETLTKAIRA